MEIKFKKLSKNAVIPKFGKPGDAGADLTATSLIYNEDTDTFDYGTDIAIEIPEGYVGMIFPRSSIYKTGLILTNHVGIIDQGYRGEIMAKFKVIATYEGIDDIDKEKGLAIGHLDEEGNDKCGYHIYSIGDRIAQLVIVPIPQVTYVESEELSETERGEGGYGSTGS